MLGNKCFFLPTLISPVPLIMIPLPDGPFLGYLSFTSFCSRRAGHCLCPPGWIARPGRCVPRACAPHLLCYVQDNFKALQFVLRRAQKGAGVLKLPERPRPFLRLLNFNSSLICMLSGLLRSRHTLWLPSFVSPTPVSLIVISLLLCFLLTLLTPF